ncbi:MULTISPECIES: phosphotransferase family protein [Kitasatospora]|uniref:Aminoglycoside phosphotransferase family protein n=1 Tax=Kitasatospora cystarginea TaxID=58350 RepID=A0ABN3DX21_9ACTN
MTTASRALLPRACAAAGLSAAHAAGAVPIRLGENEIWRLAHGVVARISRPGQWSAAAREVAVAHWLRCCGLPAVRPLDDCPGPVEVDLRPVTFWHELPPHRSARAAELAPLLRRLHGLPAPPAGLRLGRLDPFVRLAERIEGATTLAESQRSWLRRRLADLTAAWAAELPAGRPATVIHGDAWGGNVAVTSDAAYLLDFERTALGPPEWDLVSTAVDHRTFGLHSDREYTAFCATYGSDVTTWPGYPLLRSIRELRAVCYALQCAADAPHRHREQAHHRLACLQGRHGPRPWRWTPLG